MACEQWRELLSAQLDGEDEPGDSARIDDHLAGCAGCRQWLDRAAAVNRLTRTSLAAQTPDLTATVLAALNPAAAGLPAAAGDPPGVPTVPGDVVGVQAAPGGAVAAAGAVAGPGGRRLVAALYLALGAVGAVQLMLGLSQVGGGDHAHAGAGFTATPGHLWHESAAWNVAVGAGFLFMALRRSRPAGLLPMLTAFVAMLLLLSVNDLTTSRVEVARLVSHGFVITGYLLVLALSRLAGDPARPPGGRDRTEAGWRLRLDEAPASAAPATGLRLVMRAARPATAVACANPGANPGPARRAA